MRGSLACLLSLLLLTGATTAGRRAESIEITELVTTPNGKTLLVAGMDGRVRLIDLASRKQRAIVLAHQGGVWDMALSADGKRFITGGPDKLVRVWDLAKVKEFRTYDQHTQEVSAVALSPDGRLAASGDYAGLVHVWDVATGKKRFEKRGSEFRMSALAFSPDGGRLAGGGVEPAVYRGIQRSTRGTRLHLWNVATGAARILPDRGSRIAFTPAGNLAAAGFYLDFKRESPDGNTNPSKV